MLARLRPGSWRRPRRSLRLSPGHERGGVPAGGGGGSGRRLDRGVPRSGRASFRRRRGAFGGAGTSGAWACRRAAFVARRLSGAAPTRGGAGVGSFASAPPPRTRRAPFASIVKWKLSVSLPSLCTTRFPSTAAGSDVPPPRCPRRWRPRCSPCAVAREHPGRALWHARSALRRSHVAGEPGASPPSADRQVHFVPPWCSPRVPVANVLGPDVRCPMVTSRRRRTGEDGAPGLVGGHPPPRGGGVGGHGWRAVSAATQNARTNQRRWRIDGHGGPWPPCLRRPGPPPPPPPPPPEAPGHTPAALPRDDQSRTRGVSPPRHPRPRDVPSTIRATTSPRRPPGAAPTPIVLLPPPVRRNVPPWTPRVKFWTTSTCTTPWPEGSFAAAARRQVVDVIHRVGGRLDRDRHRVGDGPAALDLLGEIAGPGAGEGVRGGRDGGDLGDAQHLQDRGRSSTLEAARPQVLGDEYWTLEGPLRGAVHPPHGPRPTRTPPHAKVVLPPRLPLGTAVPARVRGTAEIDGVHQFEANRIARSMQVPDLSLITSRGNFTFCMLLTSKLVATDTSPGGAWYVKLLMRRSS